MWTPQTVNEHRARLYAAGLLPVMLPKAQLVAGAYYVGMCRNANVARWDGQRFHHWRRKWGHDFVETIKHPDDEQTFDAFVPVARCGEHGARPIELSPVAEPDQAPVS